MAQSLEPREFPVTSTDFGLYVISHPQNGETLKFGDGFRLPRAFTVTLLDPRYRVRLEVVALDGRPECDGIRRLDETAPPLTGKRLRAFPLESILKDAVGHLAMYRVSISQPGPGDTGTVEIWSGNSLQSRALAGTKYLAVRPKKSRRRSPPSDAELTKVAASYRKAYRERRSTRDAVKKEMHCSSSSASRLIRQARDRGFLGAATPRRAGELPPENC